MFQDEQGWYKDVHYQERAYRDKSSLTEQRRSLTSNE